MAENAEEPDEISARAPVVGADDGALRAYIDVAVADQVAVVRSDLTAAVEAADADRITRLDHRLAQTVAALAEIIDAARQDAVAAAPDEATTARVIAVENGLRDGLDRVHGSVVAVAEQIAAVRQELSQRLDALEQRDGPELRGLAQVVDGLRGGSLTAADLDVLRADVEALAAAGGELAERFSNARAEAADEAEELIAMVGSDLTQRLDRLTRQVAEVGDSAAQAEAALDLIDTVEQRVTQEIARLAESVEARRVALTTQVSEIEERLGGMVRQASRTPSDPAPSSGGRRKIRGADVARLVESVEAWRAESVGEEEFFALRSELEKLVARRVAAAQAEMQHRIEMVEAVLADGGADAGDTASLRRDLRTLQEKVATLRTSPPKAKGKPRESG